MNMNDIILVQCGCGGEPYFDYEEFCFWGVKCKKCGISTGHYHEYDDETSKKRASEIWNLAMSGYSKALQDMNEPMMVIQENWSYSVCPRCKKSFYDYEEDDDGYITRATSMIRCPHCGQRLKWYEDIR